MGKADLWTTIDGEEWMDNPLLVTANPKRRAKAMAAQSKKRSQRPRKNFYGPGLIANPPKKRHHHRRRASNNPHRKRKYSHNTRMQHYHRRKTYKRNPLSGESAGQFMGIALPPIDAVIYTGAGFIVPPILASMITSYLPASMTTGSMATITPWLVNLASVVVPAMAVRKFVSTRAGNLMLIGGGVWLTMQAIKTFAPGVIPGLGSQPLLGKYQRQLGAYSTQITPNGIVPFKRPNGTPPIIANSPDRLSPQGRF